MGLIDKQCANRVATGAAVGGALGASIGARAGAGGALQDALLLLLLLVLLAVVVVVLLVVVVSCQRPIRPPSLACFPNRRAVRDLRSLPLPRPRPAEDPIHRADHHEQRGGEQRGGAPCCQLRGGPRESCCWARALGELLLLGRGQGCRGWRDGRCRRGETD